MADTTDPTPRYGRILTAHGTYLQAFPDGSVRAVKNPGRGATFQLLTRSQGWEPLPPPPPPPPGPGPLIPITYGVGADGLMDRHDFLRPYFGPACVGDDVLFARNLKAWVARGDSVALLNGSQDPWMRPNHPLWGIGFAWWEPGGLDLLIARCRQLRAHGLIPHVSCFDQPDIGRESGDGQIDTSRGGFSWADQVSMFTDFVQALNGECSLINYSWELDERWHASDLGWMATQALPTLCQIVYDVNPELRFAVHTAREEWGGFNLYGSMPSNATRYWQMRGTSTVAHIREVAHRLGPVHQRHPSTCVVMEHSPSTRLVPQYSQAEANRRAQAGVEVVQGYLPDAQIGSLNGDPR